MYGNYERGVKPLEGKELEEMVNQYAGDIEVVKQGKPVDTVEMKERRESQAIPFKLKEARESLILLEGLGDEKKIRAKQMEIAELERQMMAKGKAFRA